MLTGAGRTLVYDAVNRLTSVTTAGGTTSFVYDGDSARVQKMVPIGGGSTKTVKYFDKWVECETSGGTTACTKYIWAGDLRVDMKLVAGGALTYYHTDRLGTTAVVTDGAGTQQESIQYYPFGEQWTDTGTANVPYKYTGQEYDASTGLYFYRARYYDAHLGRFIQPDTIISNPHVPAAWNRYTYVMNNPLKYTDPTGHEGEMMWNLGLAGGLDLASALGALTASRGIPYSPQTLLNAGDTGGTQNQIQLAAAKTEPLSSGPQYVVPGDTYTTNPRTGQIDISMTTVNIPLGTQVPLDIQQFFLKTDINAAGSNLPNFLPESPTFAPVEAGKIPDIGTVNFRINANNLTVPVGYLRLLPPNLPPGILPPVITPFNGVGGLIECAPCKVGPPQNYNQPFTLPLLPR